MSGKLVDKNHRDLFRTRLEDLIDPNHELALLANAIDWQYFENGFKPYCSDKGVQINALKTANAWNMKKMMEKLKEKIWRFIFRLFFMHNVYYYAA